MRDLAALSGVDCESFFTQDPTVNPASHLRQGAVRSLREEDLKNPVMHEICRLNKLVDELAPGRAMEKGFFATAREASFCYPFANRARMRPSCFSPGSTPVSI